MHSVRFPRIPYHTLAALAYSPMHLEELVQLSNQAPDFYFQLRPYSNKTIFEEVISMLTPRPRGLSVGEEELQNFLTNIVKFSFNSFGDSRNTAHDCMLVYSFISAQQLEKLPLTIVINMLPSNLALYCFNILAEGYKRNEITFEDYIALLTQNNEEGYTPLHYIIKNSPILLSFYLHALSAVLGGEALMFFHNTKTAFDDSYLDYIQYHGDAKILNLYIDHLLNSIEPADKAWSVLYWQAQAKHKSRKLLEDPKNEFIQYLIKLGENSVRTKIDISLFGSPRLSAMNCRHFSFIRNWREVPYSPPSTEPLFNSKVFGPELLPVDNDVEKTIVEAREEDNGDFRPSYSLML